MSKNGPKLPPVDPGGSGDGSDKTTGRQSKAERRAAAAALLQEQKRRERRRTIAFQAGIGAVVVALVVAVTIALLSRSGDDATPPANMSADGTIRFGADDAPVTLTAVEDFQCPVCAAFEQENGDLLAGYRDGDQVAVEYRLIAFLDRASTTDYSSRAMNASMCVLDEDGPDTWLDYHGLLYANQPAEGGEGLSDDQLIELAQQAGATGSGLESCVEDRAFGDWVEQATDAAFDDDVSGTPTIFVNGDKLDGFDRATIEDAVAAASGS